MALEDLVLVVLSAVLVAAVLALLVDRRRLKALPPKIAEVPMVPSDVVALTNAVARVEARLEAEGIWPPSEVGLAARVKALADVTSRNAEIEASLAGVGGRLTDLAEISVRVDALEALLIPKPWDDPARVAFDFLVAWHRGRMLDDLQGTLGRMALRGPDAAAYARHGLDHA